MVKLSDGSNALLTGDEPFDPIRANGENGVAVAQRLGIDPALTWAEAARQLNIPLYSVCEVLEVPEELNEDGWMGSFRKERCWIIFQDNAGCASDKAHPVLSTGRRFACHFLFRSCCVIIPYADKFFFVSRDDSALPSV